MTPANEWLSIVGLAAAWAIFEWLLGTVWRNRKQAGAHSWPVAIGRITKATVFSGKHDVTLTLSYAYPVADEPYPIPAEFEKEFYRTEDAQAWADALGDQMVPVHVNPKNSWKSLLLDSELEVMVKSSANGHPTAARIPDSRADR
jgi:hypothetical protein